MCNDTVGTPFILNSLRFKKVSEYDGEIPQSLTADQPTVLYGRAT